MYRLEICAQIRVLWVCQPSVEVVFAEVRSEHGKARLIDKIHQQADMLFCFIMVTFTRVSRTLIAVREAPMMLIISKCGGKGLECS